LNVYEIIGDHGSDHFVRGVWSEDKTNARAYAAGVWVPTNDLKFSEDGRISTEDVARFANHWLVVVKDKIPELDVVGDFTLRRQDLPAINAALKDALSSCSSDPIEFIESHRIWDEKQHAAVSGGPFYLVNLLKRRNCWDLDAMELATMRKNGGSTFQIVNGAKKAVRSSQIPDAGIWREERTGHVLCTESVKEAFEAAGCRGWIFRQLPVTAK